MVKFIDRILMKVDRIIMGRICRWILNVVLITFSALLVCMAVYAMSHNQYGLALLMTIVAAFTAYAARDLV